MYLALTMNSSFSLQDGDEGDEDEDGDGGVCPHAQSFTCSNFALNLCTGHYIRRGCNVLNALILHAIPWLTFD